VIELSEQTIMDQLTERLSARFPQVPAETVASVVQDQHARFHGRPVRDYIPFFAVTTASAD
jgi:hypothetical protein